MILLALFICWALGIGAGFLLGKFYERFYGYSNKQIKELVKIIVRQ